MSAGPATIPPPSMSNIWYELSVGRYSPQSRNHITDTQERNFTRLFTKHMAQNPTFPANIARAAQVAVEQRSPETIIAQYTKELSIVSENRAKIAALESRCSSLENRFGALFVGTLFGGLVLLGYVSSRKFGPPNHNGPIIFRSN